MEIVMALHGYRSKQNGRRSGSLKYSDANGIHTNRVLFIFALLLQGCSLSPISWNVWGPINQRHGLAVSGYDVVAFHTERIAIQGEKLFTFRWKGVEWRFASAENRKLFSSDPARYAPQYGGYCAYSVSKGITFYGDPEHWLLEQNRLFFFFNGFTRKLFHEKIHDGIIERADANWKGTFPDAP